jgi:membrane-bound metal-dependent hydrolase YbcI (DUF457 family)
MATLPLSYRHTRALRRRWHPGVATVIGCVGVIGLADLLIWRWKGAPYAVEALLDEPAHVATGLLALTACGLVFELPVVLAVLAGSLLIDTDHWPGVFGSRILEHGVPRPYTHSLGTIVVLVAVALLLKGRKRELTLIAALALALHFFRDMAEPGGPGVSLLWPLSDHAVTVRYLEYAAVIVALAAAALVRRRVEARQAVARRAIPGAKTRRS